MKARPRPLASQPCRAFYLSVSPSRSRTRTIHTHQRRIITKLRNNPAATEIADLTFEGTAGAVFELPADLISFRSARRKLSPTQAQAAAANLDEARRAA